MNTGDATPATRTAAAILGRRADTTRRRERVLAALAEARSRGAEITATGIAQQARVDRTFLYRHPDLLAELHAAQAQPPHDNTLGPAASMASLHADLLAAHERAARLAAHNQQLERRLSQALGDQAWRESGLGAPHDRDQLTQRITTLEQQVVDLKLELDERDEELAAARAANRELITRINTAV
jgi:hypothetical protein